MKKNDAADPMSLSYNINSHGLNIVTEVKILGIIFSNTLSWRAQASSVCKRINAMLATLRRTRHLLNARTRASICKAYIEPHIRYCAAVWGNADKGTMSRLVHANN